MISIVIPVYNEKNGLLPALDELYQMLPTLGEDYEVILVDDGSDDGTREIIEGLKRPALKSVRHHRNRGYGASLLSGIDQAAGDTIVITDADGTYPAAALPEILRHYRSGGFAMVVGARVTRQRDIPLIRRPAKWVLTRLASYLTETRIPDLNSGLRVMNREIIERYRRLLPDGFSFTTTITLIMLSKGFPVAYLPVDYFKREGKSKIRPLHDSLLFLQLIIRTVMYFNPLKIFIPLSLVFFLLALLFAFGSWQLTGRIMDVTCGILILTGVNVLTIGMLADLIDKRLD
ncbi:MAG: glycosyltransferase family 2 protein [Deltaproteobacteria bacterium]|nr:glycosyltransferase family 2 protein [Deltaproteobacteria bacterium]